jgi:ribonuclease Z
VVGDPRPGRRLVYTGDTRPVDAVVDAAADADLLIHDATFADDERDRARHTGHSTAREAGQVAARAGAERLALTHLSSRYAGRWERLEREAREAFDGECFVASDGQTVDVPYPE